MMHSDTLIAIDVHQHCGAALFDRTGRLLAFDRLGATCDGALRSAASEVLGAGDSLHWLFSAGQPAAQAVWERAAMREGVRVQRVGQSDWQQALLGPQRSAADAQQATLSLAQAAIAEAGLAATRPSLAEARAICVGLWAARQLAQRAAQGAPAGRAQLGAARRRGKIAASSTPSMRQVA